MINTKVCNDRCNYYDTDIDKASCCNCMWTSESSSDKADLYEPSELADAEACIKEMIEVFGKPIVSAFCLCNVWQYRKTQKNKDLADWYLNVYIDLKEEMLEDDRSFKYFGDMLSKSSFERRNQSKSEINEICRLLSQEMDIFNKRLAIIGEREVTE